MGRRAKEHKEEENTKIEMSIFEFLNFKKLASKKDVTFGCNITKDCNYIVECDNKDFMLQLGYVL